MRKTSIVKLTAWNLYKILPERQNHLDQNRENATDDPIFLHLGFPLLLSAIFYKGKVRKTYLILLLTMLVDADHLLASPVYDPYRCSIGFHPLHTYYIMPLYVAFIFIKPVRVIGIGLTLHMITDALDCYFQNTL